VQQKTFQTTTVQVKSHVDINDQFKNVPQSSRIQYYKATLLAAAFNCIAYTRLYENT